MALSQADKLSRISRFYTSAGVAPQSEVDGYAVTLDGRIAKTAAGARLVVPTEALARLLAEEWAAQGEFIDFAAMPATRLAFTVIDRAADARAGLAAEVRRYAGADVLAYPAEGPRSLAERQAEAWGPWRDWAHRALGAALQTADGRLHVAQPEATLSAMERHAADLDDFSLAGVAFATALFGSAVLALAVQRGALSAVEAFELSRLEEAWQAEQWGLDAEAEARTAALRTEAAMIGRWFEALGAP